MGEDDERTFCTGDSHRIGCNPIHILIYTSGLPEHPQMAETRKKEIEQNHPQAQVFVQKVDDLGKLSDVVDQMTMYGPTKEFSVWSHAAYDGPTGEVDVSRPEAKCFNLDDQLYLDEWASIDFDWTECSFAVFYGCRTAMGHSKKDGERYPVLERGNDPEVPFSKTAFAYKFLLRHPDLFAAAGQPWYTMPSVYRTGKSRSREPSDSEEEPIFSVAWRGADMEQAAWYQAITHPREHGLEAVYWGGIDDEVMRWVYRDEGFQLRVFYREPVSGEENVGVARVWPNVIEREVEECWARSERSVVATGD